MTHVVNVQLSLDDKSERRDGNHVLYLGNFALERVSVTRKHGICFCADYKRVYLKQRLIRKRNHASDRGFDKTYSFKLFGSQLRLKERVYVFVRVHEVFADEQVYRTFSFLESQLNSEYKVGDYVFYSLSSYAGHADITVANSSRGGVMVVSVHCRHIFYSLLVRAAGVNYLEGVFAASVQLVHNGCGNIDITNVISSLVHNLTYESASYISGADYYSILSHIKIIPYYI